MADLISRALDVAQAFRRPGGLRALAAGRPRSVASWRLVGGLLEDAVAFQTVIDGGANVGQFARAASWAFPQAQIFSFEPLPEIAAIYRHNLADVDRCSLANLALGDVDGTVEFHRHACTQSSSILRAAHNEASNGVQTLTVPIARLDTFFANHDLAEPVLLKLDLQGYELPALKGAVRLLERVSHVLTETVFIEAYDQEPLFEELWRFMDQAGFSFTRPLAALRDKRDRIYQIDALFRRREQPSS